MENNLTLAEFLDVLNSLSYEDNQFKAINDNYEETISICYEDNQIIVINDDGEIQLLKEFFTELDQFIQNKFMKYFIETDSSQYRFKKKYNIVIGKDTKHPIYSAYRKCGNSEYAVDSNVFKEELKDEKYVFTEDEVKDLESQLVSQSACTLSSLVTFGKMEV